MLDFVPRFTARFGRSAARITMLRLRRIERRINRNSASLRISFHFVESGGRETRGRKLLWIWLRPSLAVLSWSGSEPGTTPEP
jgi:hypothetical protein